MKPRPADAPQSAPRAATPLWASAAVVFALFDLGLARLGVAARRLSLFTEGPSLLDRLADLGARTAPTLRFALLISSGIAAALHIVTAARGRARAALAAPAAAAAGLPLLAHVTRSGSLALATDAAAILVASVAAALLLRHRGRFPALPMAGLLLARIPPHAARIAPAALGSTGSPLVAASEALWLVAPFLALLATARTAGPSRRATRVILAVSAALAAALGFALAGRSDIATGVIADAFSLGLSGLPPGLVAAVFPAWLLATGALAFLLGRRPESRTTAAGLALVVLAGFRPTELHLIGAALAGTVLVSGVRSATTAA